MLEPCYFLLEQSFVFATTSETPFSVAEAFFAERGGGSRRWQRAETATVGGAASMMRHMLEPADEELQAAEAESAQVAVLQSRQLRGQRRQAGSAAAHATG